MNSNYKLSFPFNYENDMEYSLENPISFIDEIAKKYIKWDKIYDKIYSGDKFNPNWFDGGKFNICNNVLDVKAKDDKFKDEIALIHECPVKGIFNELWKQVCIFSRGLKNLGIGKGDNVMIFIPNTFQCIISMLACVRIGAIYSVAYSNSTPETLSVRINYLKPKLMITVNCSSNTHQLIHYPIIISKALELSNFKNIENIIIFKRKDIISNENSEIKGEHNNVDGDELINGVEPLYEYEIMDSNDPFCLMFTSGTSGDPKSVHVLNRDFTMNPYRTFIKYGVNIGERVIMPFSAAWGISQSLIYSLLSLGAVSVLFEGDPIFPSANNLFKVISKHNVRTLVIIPSTGKLIQEMDPKGDTISNFNFSSFENIVFCGERYDQTIDDYLKMVTNNKVNVWNSYGQTELGAVISSPSFQIPQKLGSAGKPMPGYNVFILSRDGKEMGPNEIGEIVVKLPLHPNCGKRFLNENKEIIKGCQNYNKFNGYFTTNDMGYFDNDGYYYILSRINDVCCVDGKNVFVGQCEEIIQSTNLNIHESTVVGINDSIYGQRLIAFIIFKPGYIVNPIKNDNVFNSILKSIHIELNDKLSKQIGNYAQLKYLIPISKVPSTIGGKKIKSIFPKIFNGEEYEVPLSIYSIDDFKKLEIEINQFKSNINNYYINDKI